LFAQKFRDVAALGAVPTPIDATARRDDALFLEETSLADLGERGFEDLFAAPYNEPGLLEAGIGANVGNGGLCRLPIRI